MCRLPATTPWPSAAAGPLFSATRTGDELSVVCLEEAAPPAARVEGGWRALKLHGPIAFTEVGVLAALAGALAGARLSLFALSTYDTDYLLVRAVDLERARHALRRAGCEVS